MAGDDTRREGIVRGLYAAYIDGRKDDAGAMLTEDFSFSSPMSGTSSRPASG